MTAGSRSWRWLWRGLAVLGATLLVAVAVALFNGCQAFGGRAAGARRARMERSPQWKAGHFENPQPLVNSLWGMVKGAWNASPHTSPAHAPPTITGEQGRFAQPPATGVRVTWFGHSATLVEVDGNRVLTDPIWSDRASPFESVGPRRWYPAPLAIAQLPRPDAVVISHDHYDHLDQKTIVAILGRADWNAPFVVPLGLGAHLQAWGVPDTRIIELDWWDRAQVGGLTIVCTPARHASGRMLIDNDAKLWAGYAFIGPSHRVYFSGDTGLFPAMRDIGMRLGPFDLTMIEAGQYDAAWPDWHIGPEQAVRAHQMVRGRVMLPIHWGLFALAYHGWTEPVERVLAAAKDAGAQLVVPRPGQTIEPGAPPPFERWWPDLPWRTAAEAPVVSTQMN